MGTAYSDKEKEITGMKDKLEHSEARIKSLIAQCEKHSQGSNLIILN